MMYPRKLHDHFLLDPRLEQYMCVEIFPFCDDYYFYGADQLVTPFPFISEHPVSKEFSILLSEFSKVKVTF